MITHSHGTLLLDATPSTPLLQLREASFLHSALLLLGFVFQHEMIFASLVFLVHYDDRDPQCKIGNQSKQPPTPFGLDPPKTDPLSTSRHSGSRCHFAFVNSSGRASVPLQHMLMASSAQRPIGAHERTRISPGEPGCV